MINSATATGLILPSKLEAYDVLADEDKAAVLSIRAGKRVGLSIEHTNRSPQELRVAKPIEVRRKRVTILDLPGLKAFAQFDVHDQGIEARAAA